MEIHDVMETAKKYLIILNYLQEMGANSAAQAANKNDLSEVVNQATMIAQVELQKEFANGLIEVIENILESQGDLDSPESN